MINIYMKTEIVVARYNENLDWLKKIKKSKDLKITVYNKGLDDIDVPFIKIPNVGRESQTYLEHIINNYDNLADQTIFCQGDSIFHSPGFIELINKHRKKFEPVQPLSAWYWPENKLPYCESNPSVPVLEATKDLWFSKKAQVHVEYINNDFITIYPYHFFDFNIKMYVDRNKLLYNIKNPLAFNVERFRLKNVDLDYLIPFSYAGILSVNKQPILDNSIDFYNNIMSIILYDIRNFIGNRKIDHGYFLERLWLVIFNYKKYNKHYIPLKVKDYLLESYDFPIKDNKINLSYFNIYCQLYMKITIDNTIYVIYISKLNIYLKKNKESKALYTHDSKLDTNIKNILKDSEHYNILITLDKNILKIIINNNTIIEYNFNNKNIKHNNLKNITIYDVAKYNKLKIIK
jgi:hypothetical protein